MPNRSSCWPGTANRTPDTEGILTLYMGKKDAEIASGVGGETDLWAMGPSVGQGQRIEGELLTKLEVEYGKIKAKDGKVREKAKVEITRYVEELAQAAAKNQAEPSPDKIEVRDDPENENPIEG